MSTSNAVVVIGGGITGLVAARDLLIAGVDVTLIEPTHPGGKLRTTPFAGAMLGYLDAHGPITGPSLRRAVPRCCSPLVRR